MKIIRGYFENTMARTITTDDDRRSWELLGAWLRDQRLRTGIDGPRITQQTIANAASITLQHYQKIERGTTGTKLDTLVRIARALNLNEVDVIRRAGFKEEDLARVLKNSSDIENPHDVSPLGAFAFAALQDFSSRVNSQIITPIEVGQYIQWMRRNRESAPSSPAFTFVGLVPSGQIETLINRGIHGLLQLHREVFPLLYDVLKNYGIQPTQAGFGYVFPIFHDGKVSADLIIDDCKNALANIEIDGTEIGVAVLTVDGPSIRSHDFTDVIAERWLRRCYNELSHICYDFIASSLPRSVNGDEEAPRTEPTRSNPGVAAIEPHLKNIRPNLIVSHNDDGQTHLYVDVTAPLNHKEPINRPSPLAINYRKKRR